MNIVAAPKTQMLRDKRVLSAMSAGGDLRAAEWMGARGGDGRDGATVVEDSACARVRTL